MTTRAVQSCTRLGVSFRQYSNREARKLRQLVERIYKESYTAAIASGHSFDSVEAFMNRYDSYSSRPEFDHVVAYHDGRPIGQAWGWPLNQKTRWWTGLDAEPDPTFTKEDGRRTFALSEIMVVRDWTGKGIAHGLHDVLLTARKEERATLLVEPDNEPARRAYENWGWRRVAHLRPSWDDAPTFDVYIKNLPNTNT